MYAPPLALNEIVPLPSQIAHAGAIWFVSLNVTFRAESCPSEILSGWLKWADFTSSQIGLVRPMLDVKRSLPVADKSSQCGH